jgi:hypothetical protein
MTSAGPSPSKAPTENVRNGGRSLAALLRSRPLQPASPDLAERIIRKAKHIRQRVQTKPQKTRLFQKKQLRRKKTDEEDRECPQLVLFLLTAHGTELTLVSLKFPR